MRPVPLSLRRLWGAGGGKMAAAPCMISVQSLEEVLMPSSDEIVRLIGATWLVFEKVEGSAPQH